MARPTKRRRICQMPQIAAFMPCEKETSDCVELGVDEYETIRLIDYLNFTQEDCAVQMNVARTTVQAIYDTARKKLADTLVNGKRLVIRGGSYDVCVNAPKCCGKDCKESDCRGKRCEGSKQHCHGCKKQMTFEDTSCKKEI